MEKLSVVMITKNESANIADCLQTCAWADEIIVLDTGSEDDTVRIAKEQGAQVFKLERWAGFGLAKQQAVDLATNDWILSIDADERLSNELQKELIALRERDFEHKAWHLKRRSYYLGKPIRFCGWQNDAPLRVFNRTKGGFNDLVVHEGIKVQQSHDTCQNLMLHLTYPTLDSHFRKIRFYAELADQKKESSPVAALRAAHKFFKMYIIKLGFLDGWQGFLLCKNSAWGIWYKYKR
ncbi:MAG: glycosyltransferase family 2 protein [Candidatus Cloacimonetes bacterium]|nr:glycosyltransferase family 2 protein [Candidatus Cloacimonadota bacterium]MDD2422644.1 glycosyltransferase family 2 protein [Candidatus Cloacimonadota bacterium]MDD4277175.1 glycosyltransferase family 2 protein [Candidatus Cloacimonadota bacterium]